MEVDLEGKVRNLPRLSQALTPVFEAVVNSIDAIEERKNGRGRITVKIVREETDQTTVTFDDEGNFEGERKWPEIKDFIIEDDGIGFNKKNWDSFNKSDSSYKQSKGGKGIGRFDWLKAFDKAQIRSVYQENGVRFLREFEFNTKGKGVHPKRPIQTDDEIKTIVALKEFKKEYRDDETAFKSTQKIAQRILEHFLAYYINESVPEIVIEDIHGKSEDNKHLDELYKQYIIHSDLLEINGRNFSIYHVELPTTRKEDVHQIVYCAMKRDVKPSNLSNHLGTDSIDKDGKPVYYSAYITGEYLDQKVNSSRNAFNFPNKDYLGADGSYEISEKTLQNKIIEKIKIYLADYLEVIKNKKQDHIERVVSENPMLRKVYDRHKEVIDELDPSCTDEEIVEVLSIKKGLENHNLLEQSKDFLNSDNMDYDLDLKKKEQEKITKEILESQKEELIGYIVWRKLIIDLLERKIELNKDNKFERESVIHNIIFPMRTTTDQIDYEDHNLWIIDENLTFHNFAASDPTLNQISTSKSLERPDIIIFSEMDEKTRIAGAVSVIEFKKPMRDNFDKNPVQQLYNKVRAVRNESVKLPNGRTLHVDATTRFYCYAICDLTDEIRTFAEDSGYSPLRNELGYYFFNPHHKAHTEIIDFDKLVIDVKNRHKIFFEKLGIGN
jgi:hypothetical protein